MAEVEGSLLEEIWDQLPLEERIPILDDLVAVERKLSSVFLNRYSLCPDSIFILSLLFYVDLNRFGSIYFASENVPGAVPVEITGVVAADANDHVKQRYSISPVTDADFWRKERATMEIDRGPCMFPILGIRTVRSNSL